MISTSLVLCCIYVNVFFAIDALKQLVHIRYLENGSNGRDEELQAWVNFGDFVDECEGTQEIHHCNNLLFFLNFPVYSWYNTMHCIRCLVFFTGANAIPPLGYEMQPTVTFLHSKCDRFCKASTCDLTLRLPTCHDENYSSFREEMIMSLLDNDGFGGA